VELQFSQYIQQLLFHFSNCCHDYKIKKSLELWSHNFVTCNFVTFYSKFLWVTLQIQVLQQRWLCLFTRRYLSSQFHIARRIHMPDGYRTQFLVRRNDPTLQLIAL